MGIIPIIRDALGPLNNSHGLSRGLQSVIQFDKAGAPVDLINSKRALTVSNYAFDATGANGPSFKASTLAGYMTPATSIPVTNSAWTISALTRFPIDNNQYAIFAKDTPGTLYHCLRDAAATGLGCYNGSSIVPFSPAIDIFALSGWLRLTVVGNSAGGRASLNGLLAGSHSQPINAAIGGILGDAAILTRAWGAAKDYFIWNRELSQAEVMDHTLDPFAMFADGPALSWLLASAGTGVTGTIASTEANDVLAATGSVKTVGTIATTEAADVLAALGFLGFTGTIAATEAKDVLAATGKVYITGTAPLVESADVLAATGTVSQPARTGTIALIEAGDTFAASGSSGATDRGGIISRASIKRLKRKAEEDRKRRESTWEAGLLASKELVEQVTRAMDGEPIVAAQKAIAKFIDDEEEEIEMLLMAA